MNQSETSGINMKTRLMILHKMVCNHKAFRKCKPLMTTNHIPFHICLGHPRSLAKFLVKYNQVFQQLFLIELNRRASFEGRNQNHRVSNDHFYQEERYRVLYHGEHNLIRDHGTTLHPNINQRPSDCPWIPGLIYELIQLPKPFRLYKILRYLQEAAH